MLPLLLVLYIGIDKRATSVELYRDLLLLLLYKHLEKLLIKKQLEYLKLLFEKSSIKARNSSYRQTTETCHRRHRNKFELKVLLYRTFNCCCNHQQQFQVTPKTVKLNIVLSIVYHISVHRELYITRVEKNFNMITNNALYYDNDIKLSTIILSTILLHLFKFDKCLQIDIIVKVLFKFAI